MDLCPCQTTPKPPQTIPEHFKTRRDEPRPSQTISEHRTPVHAIPNHSKAPQTTRNQFKLLQTIPEHGVPRCQNYPKPSQAAAYARSGSLLNSHSASASVSASTCARELPATKLTYSADGPCVPVFYPELARLVPSVRSLTLRILRAARISSPYVTIVVGSLHSWCLVGSWRTTAGERAWNLCCGSKKVW